MSRILPIVLAGVCLAATEAIASNDVRVFLVAGQSNAVGCGADAAALPPDLRAPQPDVMFWFEEGSWDSVHEASRRIRSDEWIPLQFQSDPLYGTFGTVVDGFGPEIKLGRLLADGLDGDVAVLKFAINATSLASDWDPETAGSLYQQMLVIIDDALTTLADQGRTGRLAGFFWMQGEWDALSRAEATAYKNNLVAFVGLLRAACGDSALPFVLGRLNAHIAECPFIRFPYLEVVRTAQADVGASVSRAAMVNTDDLPLNSDRLHFTAAGQLGLGERFAQAYLALRRSLGDLNCDGRLDTFDIDPFVLALISGPGFAAYYDAYPSCDAMLADVNRDGAVNVFDIDPFVELLIGG